MRVSINDEKCSRSSVTLHEMAWSHIRSIVASIELPDGWKRQFTPTALVTFNKSRTLYVKITQAGEVFVDRKQRNMSFKSQLIKFPHVEDACNTAREIILQSL